MNSRKLMITIATAAALCAGSAMAGEVYKYTDEDGNVQYGDRPSGEPNEERMYVASKRTDNAAVQRQYQERYATPPQSSAGDQAAQDGEETEAQKLTRREKAQARAERQASCQKNRDRMQTLLNSRRLYREDDNGERVYLDDADRQDARDKVQALIEEYCD